MLLGYTATTTGVQDFGVEGPDFISNVEPFQKYNSSFADALGLAFGHLLLNLLTIWTVSRWYLIEYD